MSYADLIAWAGAKAVAVTGGPAIGPLAVGRADAAGPDPEGRMASENSNAERLIENFADKGFNVRELVALSGAHTIGAPAWGGCMQPGAGGRPGVGHRVRWRGARLGANTIRGR